MTKPTKWPVHSAKTQISLDIRPVWSESSLSAWRSIGSLTTDWVHSKDSDQSGRMPRLIWVFAGHIFIFGFVMSWLKCFIIIKDLDFKYCHIIWPSYLSYNQGNDRELILPCQIQLCKIWIPITFLIMQSDEFLLPFKLCKVLNSFYLFYYVKCWIQWQFGSLLVKGLYFQSIKWYSNFSCRLGHNSVFSL